VCIWGLGGVSGGVARVISLGIRSSLGFMMFRLFIANAKGTFFGMSESLEASSRR
jgi:hypothetical protein